MGVTELDLTSLPASNTICYVANVLLQNLLNMKTSSCVGHPSRNALLLRHNKIHAGGDRTDTTADQSWRGRGERWGHQLGDHGAARHSGGARQVQGLPQSRQLLRGHPGKMIFKESGSKRTRVVEFNTRCWDVDTLPVVVAGSPGVCLRSSETDCEIAGRFSVVSMPLFVSATSGTRTHIDVNTRLRRHCAERTSVSVTNVFVASQGM